MSKNRDSFFSLRRSPFSPTVLVKQFWGHRLLRGYLFLFFIFTALALLASTNFESRMRIFVEDEIASHDITATRDLLFDDKSATLAQQERVSEMQPLVCDLTLEPVSRMHEAVHDLFTSLQNNSNSTAVFDVFWEQLAADLPEAISSQSVRLLLNPEAQKLILERSLPWLEERLREGVVSDVRVLLPYQKGGLLIRDLATNAESLRTNIHTTLDVKSLTDELALMLKRETTANPHIRRAVVDLLGGLIIPTLTPNHADTKLREEEAIKSLEPVKHRVQRGEILVRQGERVTSEQQLKLQALFRSDTDFFRHTTFWGILIIAVIISLGLIYSPSGVPSSPINNKDIVFIASLVGLFALLAKLIEVSQGVIDQWPTLSVDALGFSLPVAGAAGLAALVFSTRRYFVLGLLLAFFCTVMQKGSLGLFLFYFLSAMWNTWLVARTQTRQQVVGTILPLTLGVLFLWAGVTLMQGGVHTRYFGEALAVVIGSSLSLFLVFALSPIAEQLLGYVTRFRLMELLNLEQPALQQLMLTAPGTYHHSFVLSSLAESAAKAVGANSLLCKVAALYHDLGKLTKPAYFIENQFGRYNPHDDLTPSMSALILTSHVKRGIEIAKDYNIGKEIRDIIEQHHGTSVIRYFYQRSLDLDEKTNIDDYRYPGPRPQSREAAIVMLADAVEASSRTLSDPTPGRIKSHVNTIIKGIFAEGQLDESDLTFKDLNKLSESFQRTLNGFFHQRIEYPEKKTERPTNSSKQQKPTAEMHNARLPD